MQSRAIKEWFNEFGTILNLYKTSKNKSILIENVEKAAIQFLEKYVENSKKINNKISIDDANLLFQLIYQVIESQKREELPGYTFQNIILSSTLENNGIVLNDLMILSKYFCEENYDCPYDDKNKHELRERWLRIDEYIPQLAKIIYQRIEIEFEPDVLNRVGVSIATLEADNIDEVFRQENVLSTLRELEPGVYLTPLKFLERNKLKDSGGSTLHFVNLALHALTLIRNSDSRKQIEYQQALLILECLESYDSYDSVSYQRQEQILNEYLENETLLKDKKAKRLLETLFSSCTYKKEEDIKVELNKYIQQRSFYSNGKITEQEFIKAANKTYSDLFVKYINEKKPSMKDLNFIVVLAEKTPSIVFEKMNEDTFYDVLVGLVTLSNSPFATKKEKFVGDEIEKRQTLKKIKDQIISLANIGYDKFKNNEFKFISFEEKYKIYTALATFDPNKMEDIFRQKGILKFLKNTLKPEERIGSFDLLAENNVAIKVTKNPFAALVLYALMLTYDSSSNKDKKFMKAQVILECLIQYNSAQTAKIKSDVLKEFLKDDTLKYRSNPFAREDSHSIKLLKNLYNYHNSTLVKAHQTDQLEENWEIVTKEKKSEGKKEEVKSEKEVSVAKSQFSQFAKTEKTETSSNKELLQSAFQGDHDAIEELAKFYQNKKGQEGPAMLFTALFSAKEILPSKIETQRNILKEISVKSNSNLDKAKEYFLQSTETSKYALSDPNNLRTLMKDRSDLDPITLILYSVERVDGFHLKAAEINPQLTQIIKSLLQNEMGLSKKEADNLIKEKEKIIVSLLEEEVKEEQKIPKIPAAKKSIFSKPVLKKLPDVPSEAPTENKLDEKKPRSRIPISDK